MDRLYMGEMSLGYKYRSNLLQLDIMGFTANHNKTLSLYIKTHVSPKPPKSASNRCIHLKSLSLF